MWILVVALVILGIIALVAGGIRNSHLQKKLDNGEIEKMPEVVEPVAECCGQYEICEQDSLLAAVSKDVEYYDDEELDRYRGMASDAYTENQAEEFREVFYTMEETDVPGWVRSLTLRSIEMPDAMKDEVLLIVNERRKIS